MRLYRDALLSLQGDLERRGFTWRNASELERDIFLSEYIAEHYDMGKKTQEFAVRLAALHKIMPHLKFRIALATLQACKSRLPVRQAPACSADLANALAVLAWGSGQREVVVVIALAFYGLLRISEPLRLRRADVVVLPTGLCLLLAETKRGFEQKVVIGESWIRTMVQTYLADPDANRHRKRHTNEDKWLPLSYAQFRYWLRKLLAALHRVDALDVAQLQARRGEPLVEHGLARRRRVRSTPMGGRLLGAGLPAARRDAFDAVPKRERSGVGSSFSARRSPRQHLRYFWATG